MYIGELLEGMWFMCEQKLIYVSCFVGSNNHKFIAALQKPNNRGSKIHRDLHHRAKNVHAARNNLQCFLLKTHVGTYVSFNNSFIFVNNIIICLLVPILVFL